MWRFNPRDRRLGVPTGRVQELRFMFVPRGVSLVTLLALEAMTMPGRGRASIGLVDLAVGTEEHAIVDPFLQWQRVELDLMRFSSQLLRGVCPEGLSHVASVDFPEVILTQVIGEHHEALSLTRTTEGGQVRLVTYPIPAGPSRTILLVRDGGPLPS